MAQPPQLPQLMDNNFSNWKFRVECILDEKNVKVVASSKLEDQLVGLDEKAKTEARSKDAKAKSVIVHCLTDRHLEYVKDCQTSFEMLECLKKVFERKSMLSKLYIRRQLLSLKCNETTSIQDHFIKYDSLIRELESTGTKLNDPI